jgi:hypothetical protein
MNDAQGHEDLKKKKALQFQGRWSLGEIPYRLRRITTGETTEGFVLTQYKETQEDLSLAFKKIPYAWAGEVRLLSGGEKNKDYMKRTIKEIKQLSLA